MIKVGIECENLEDPKSRWGVGQITFNLLHEYVKNKELQKRYKLYLYFKKRVPDDEIFKVHYSLFIIRILGFPSFNIFYHILMPLRAMADRLDWMFFPAYQLPPLYIGKSIVMLSEDVYYEYKYGSLPFRYRLSYRIFSNWAAKFATKILAMSEISKKNITKLYGVEKNRVFVNYLGVGLSLNDQSLRTKALNLRPLAFSYILYVGQAFPRRHLKETVLAFKKISKEFPGLKLIALGKDKYSPPVISGLIKNANQELGEEKIIYHDYIEKREDVDQLYAGAKALIYVSDREAFGLPPVEALAFGIPPIIMDNELGHELFGEYAIYAKSGNVEDIAGAIKRALSDEQKIQEIRTKGPEFVKKYNWKNFADIFFNHVKN